MICFGIPTDLVERGTECLLTGLKTILSALQTREWLSFMNFLRPGSV